MKQLGSVLPTAASIKCNNDYAKRVAAENVKFAAKALPGIVPRNVRGELRYYKTETLYAIVSTISRNTVRWFEVRADGDYALTR